MILMHNLLEGRIAPRWMVFLAEQLLTTAAWILALFTLTLLGIELPDTRNFLLLLLANQVVSIASMLVLRTHHGIVRYSEIRDVKGIIRFGMMQFILLLLLQGIVFPSVFSPAQTIFLVALNVVLSTLSLISFRLLVKHIYAIGFGKSIKKEHILIYGAGKRGLAMCKAINDTLSMGMHVSGFIEDDLTKVGKSILSKPVISSDVKTLSVHILQNGIKKLIIATSLSAAKKTELTDLCAELQIRLHYLPAVEDWLHQGPDRLSILDIQADSILDGQADYRFNPLRKEEYRNATILVTGAAGNIGLTLCKQLCLLPVRQIILLDVAESGLHDAMIELKEWASSVDIRMELASVREEKRINRIMQKYRPDMIFHAASYNHSRSVEHFPAEVIMTNVKGTKIMADAAIRHKVRTFMLISSNKAVHPTNLLGACKRFAELYIQLLHSVDQTEFMITRFGNVLGTSNSVVAQFQKQIENGKPLTVAHPGSTRYFMSVNDATALILESAVIGKGGDTFVFDMGQPLNLVDVAEKVIKLSGKMPGRDVQISFCGLRPGEKIFEQLIAETEKLTKTSHPGIMRVKGRNIDSRIIDALIDMVYYTETPEETIIQRMWELMPELDGIKPGGALRYMGSPYQQAEDHFQQSKTSIQ